MKCSQPPIFSLRTLVGDLVWNWLKNKWKRSHKLKKNYILSIYEEHLTRPYCIGTNGLGSCTTCGCEGIRTRLFDAIANELDINPDGTFRYRDGRWIGNVRDLSQQRQMIENLFTSLNGLTKKETRIIGGIAKNKLIPDVMHQSFLVFIILEIWRSLRSLYQSHREDALSYFLGQTKNKVVYGLIKSMDDHFKAHHYRKDPSQNQF